MKTKIAYSNLKNGKEAVKELKNKFGENAGKFIIYFASSNYEPAELANEMNSSFGDTKVFGCTTAGELISGQMLKNSVVAMAFSDEVIDDIEIVSIKNLKDGINLNPAKQLFEGKFNKKLSELEHDKYFGIVLIDGLSGKEESFMDELGNMTDIIFIG